MTELTYGGLVFLLLVAVDLAFYYASWLNRIPKVDGYTIEGFTRQELKVWQHQTGWFKMYATLNPIRHVDTAIKNTDIAVEIELQCSEQFVPKQLRFWMDGVKYALDQIQNEPMDNDWRKVYYSSIVAQSEQLIKRHDPIIEEFH